MAKAYGDSREIAWKEVLAGEKAFNANELEKVAAMYVEDGARMPPNAETAKGHDAILAQLQESKAMMSGVELEFEKTVVEGTLAATHGTYNNAADRGKKAHEQQAQQPTANGANLHRTVRLTVDVELDRHGPGAAALDHTQDHLLPGRHDRLDGAIGARFLDGGHGNDLPARGAG